MFIIFAWLFFSKVFCFKIQENCLYGENGTEFLWDGNEIKVQFFIPFNWRNWNENNQLDLTLQNHFNIVLMHPSKLRKGSIKAEDKLLLVDYLKVGWNEIFLAYDSSAKVMTISDMDKRIWFSKYLKSVFSIKIKGLYAIVNCNSEFRYFQVSKWNYKIPLTLSAEDEQTGFTLYSRTGCCEVRIKFSRRWIWICSKGNDHFYISSNDCEEKEYRTFYNGIDYNVIIGQQMQFYKKNYLKSENFKFTDFLIHTLNGCNTLVRTKAYSDSNITYSDCAPSYAMDTHAISLQEILFIVANVVSFSVAFIFLVLCIKERKRRIMEQQTSRKETQETQTSHVHHPESEQESESYLYALNNDLNEDFQSRMNKTTTVHPPESEQESESYSYSLNNDLYEDFQSRMNKTTTVHHPESEQESESYSYALNNDLYEDFQSRMNKTTTVHPPESEQESESYSYALNNDLYEDFQSRMNKTTTGQENIQEELETSQYAEYELQNSLYVDFESRNAE